MVFFIKKRKVDLIFAGLGNPGTEYETTKHNVGFRVIDAFASEHFSRREFKKQLGSLVLYEKLASQKIVLIKPQTYMNLSGQTVKWLSRKYQSDDIIVIYDEMDLPPGRIRLANSGGSAGHKGMESIMSTLHKDEIRRIRIGIGGRGDIAGAEYVISPFSQEDALSVENAVGIAVKAMMEILINGFDSAMNKFNRKNIVEQITDEKGTEEDTEL